MSTKSKKSIPHNKSESTSSLGWSEWSDFELNSEPWDYPKSGQFIDPHKISMPASLQPRDWKRFTKLDNVDSPIVYESIPDYPDLITNNKHLLRSEFMRSFISTLINIQYCGRNGLEIENSSTNFSWNFAEDCWQGWFHVYSLNKAGKGAAHQPLINPNGKYIVRIFFMGCWRRVFIDDTIPVDKRGKPLLPRTANENELWPMILAKALLKVAAITWSKDREIVDCNFVTCLTGWIGLSLNVSHLSPRDQWEFLTKYAKHFEWPEDDKTIISSNSSKKYESEKGSKSRKSKSTIKKKLQALEEPRPTLLFLNLEDMRDVDAEEVPGIAPCWNHQIYVELSRDVPIDREQVKPPLANWKLHRWLDWAIRRGLIDASEYFVPMRHLLIVSPLREFNEDTIYHSYEESEDFISEENSSQTTLTINKKQVVDKTAAARILPKGKSKNDVELPDISLWGDFNKLSLYLRQVDLFYRQKFFKYSIEISDTVSDKKVSKSEKVSTKEGKKSARQSVALGSPILSTTYEYQDKTSHSRNEALYLFVDSIEDKFFLVNLSTAPHIDFSDETRKNCSLIIERHSWFEVLENNLIAELITKGTKSTVFKLETGRHLLRIYVNCEYSYNVCLLSDTPFQIGNRSKIHKLMTTESQRIQIITENISNCIKKAFEAFGTSNFASNLKLYYKSYMPNPSVQTLNSHARKTLKTVHCYFQEELFKLIENLFLRDESKFIKRALRIFFLDPSIGIATNLKLSRDDDDSEYYKNRSATLIQSFFRMFLVKCYKKIHETSHEEHNRVKECLVKVVELFNYDKHESVAQTLLRSLIKRDGRIFESFYPCASDLKHVIQVQELKGRITKNIFTTEPLQWIPIVRIVINAPQGENVFASLDNLFTNLSNYTLRVFANDTNRELFSGVNNLTPTKFKYRQSGYTVFAYGWSDPQKNKEIEWILRLITIKGEPMFRWMENDEIIPASSEIRPLLVEEISNNYIPNIRNCIAKIAVKVRKRSLMTLRLKTSYEKVLTRLRVVDENGKTMSEVEGGGAVVLPGIFLEFNYSDRQESFDSREIDDKLRSSSNEYSEKFDNYTEYFVEAFVREDSWPLTEAEWKIVKEAKTKTHGNKVKLRKSSINARISKTDQPRSKSKQLSKKTLQVNEILLPPYWILQIVSDAGNELELSQDRSKDDKICELSKIWQTGDEADRSARGRQLREKFIEDNSFFEEEIKPSDEERITINESFASFSDKNFPLETRRTLKPPSYLGNCLPKLDLTVYMEKEDEEEVSWVKSEFDEETLRNQRAMNVLDFENVQSNFIDESTDLINYRRNKYQRLRKKCLENYANRIRAIDEAYEIRQEYIDSTKNPAKSVKSKGSKGKKGA